MPTFDAAKLGALDQDVTYRTVDDLDLKMDVYYPADSGPWPGFVFVHGGAWMAGDKAPLPVNPAGTGYLVASINYRHHPAYRFPAMIEDVKCAIRYLRAHAGAYHLDAEHIAVVGHSAGGHLAALAGLAGEDAGWDTGPYRDQPSHVQAVIVMSGPSDLTRKYPDSVEEIKLGVFGPEQLESASPVRYANPGAPPFMIVHGDADPVVPVEQAYLLHNALLKAGTPSDLVIVQDAGHGFEPLGGTPTPSMEQVLARMMEFLSQMTDPPVKG
jgi:acetyl esterase/lipase